MSKPNRVLARLAQRAPIREVSCRTLTEAQERAEAERAAGFDARATQRKIGPRANPIFVFTCYVYERIVK